MKHTGGKREASTLFWNFTLDATSVFTNIGIWPRPPASRWLAYGEDFTFPDFGHLPSYRKLERWLDAHEPPQFDPRIGTSSDDIGVRLACRVLLESDGSEPDPSIFKKEFDLFWTEWRRKTATFRTITLLAGLRLEVSQIVLDRTTALRRLPDQPTWARKWLGGQFRRAETSGFSCAVVNERRTPKTSGASFDWDFGGKLGALLTALRLYCPGVGRESYHFNLQVSDFPMTRPLQYHPKGEEFGLSGGEQPCVLGPEDVRPVKRLWSLLYREHFRFARWLRVDKTRLTVAIERFDSSYDETYWLTKIVDLTIALESLFGAGDRGGVTDRLRLRTAFLLGETAAETKSIYEVVGTLYTIRSRILHGGTPEDKDIAKWLFRLTGKRTKQPLDAKLWQDAVQEARRIVRRALFGSLLLLAKPSGNIRWPLPADFDVQMAQPNTKSRWQRAFRVQLQESMPHFREDHQDS